MFAVVSRQTLIDSGFTTVICAPVYTRRDGLSTQVPVGVPEGLKHASSLWCDALVSIEKGRLTDYVGRLSASQIAVLERALRVALAVD